jgi:hypothetical protein
MLPNELINIIFEYTNPYKDYYNKNVVLYFKNKYIYSVLMRQLKQYCIYNNDKEIISFQRDAILLSI